MRPAPEFIALDTLTIRSWPDEVIDLLGHHPCSTYVENFWLGVLGPSTTFLLRHELVHVEQWKRLGVAGFLIRYVGSYLRGRLRGYGHRAAYLRIPLEAEAEWRARRPDAER